MLSSTTTLRLWIRHRCATTACSISLHAVVAWPDSLQLDRVVASSSNGPKVRERNRHRHQVLDPEQHCTLQDGGLLETSQLLGVLLALCVLLPREYWWNWIEEGSPSLQCLYHPAVMGTGRCQHASPAMRALKLFERWLSGLYCTVQLMYWRV